MVALIDTGNLVHSAIVSWDLWESIGGEINTKYGLPIDKIQVVGVGAPGPVYLEGMEECYFLEPLVIQGLSHSLTLRMSFLQEYNLKIKRIF